MDKYKNEEEGEVSPFDGLQKNAVLHEAKIFNDQQINARKCIRVITKLLYLLSRGEVFLPREASDVFFGVTKLFQNQDVNLRRMIYLIIKELNVGSDESLIVVSILSKDMTSKIDLFRANSIRVLSKIIDASMLGQIDRFLKQAIVDKNPFIVSSALVSGIHLFRIGPDVIKRWVNEVQEALNNKNKMPQYHALILLYKIKQHDRLAISKVVSALTKNAPKGPLAQCLLIRYICSILVTQSPPDKELLKFIIDCLHNKNFMVMYEAARALCRLPNLAPNQVSPAIAVLQEFATSPVPAQRFAAVRTLSEIVTKYPALVVPCTVDLEHLITDSNRSIATLAITALLKTGQESNVDRLMKSITNFITEISDEFKIVLVEAIKTLCLKFPHKYQTLVNFLSTALRDEGGFEYKKAIVNAMLDVITSIQEAKEEGLEHFCEFIEDCEFSELSVKILYLLGEEGPKTPNPAKYIRFIFNRIILEPAVVRAAAVSSLGKFGVVVPALTQNVCVLLRRCLTDNDDEVRDRVVYYLNLLEGDKKYLESSLREEIPVSLRQLEFSLNAYLKQQQKTPFNIKKHIVDLPPEEKESKEKAAVEEKKSADTATAVASPTPTNGKVSLINPYLEILSSIPDFAAYGPLFKSCKAVQITEEESEYQVSCVKHIFPNHIVFQFNVINNMEDQLLENVTVQMEPSDSSWNQDLIVPEQKLAYQVGGSCFVSFKRPDNKFSSGPIACELKFEVKEVDPSSGDVSADSNEDSYQLEELEVQEKDFVAMSEPLGLVEFKRQWDSYTEDNEVVKKYSLGLDNLQAAVDAVVELIGMQPCEDSGQVPDDKRAHAAILCGTFLGNIPVLCRAGFMLDAKHGVTLKIAVKSQNTHIAGLLASCVR